MVQFKFVEMSAVDIVLQWVYVTVLVKKRQSVLVTGSIVAPMWVEV